MKFFGFIVFISFICFANASSKMSVDKIYNTLEFPFELSAYGNHSGMQAHLAEFIESVDDECYSQNLVKLFVHNREDLIHKVSMLMVNFMNLEKVDGFEDHVKNLQASVRKVWVLDDNLRAASALGTLDDFQENIKVLYKSLDQFVLINLIEKEQRVIRTISYAKRVICGIEDAIITQHLMVIPSLFQED